MQQLEKTNMSFNINLVF